jgi:hypothetical protein
MTLLIDFKVPSPRFFSKTGFSQKVKLDKFSRLSNRGIGSKAESPELRKFTKTETGLHHLALSGYHDWVICGPNNYLR